ncbi:MAG: crotonase/enoyl-CoA hydratase family protein [Deltaproteobacteria bacterium]|nr:crotonase/enoyl-CoA hydratase family protein [Myxococcales bacterium]MDP3215607.1 crotonase/enoyl-CoA hydratase family protein [Deltaproteobacteria bacterium]
MTTPQLLTYELTDSIATVTMDDGKANVMSAAMLRALHEAFDRAEREASVVVLTGRKGMFSAGYDLSMFASRPEEIGAVLRLGGDLVHRILGFPKPVLMACPGHAVAQGAFLLLAADVRIGVTGERKIGLNEVVIGLTIPFYGIEVARHRLSAPWFQHATVTGALYAPEAALAAGFFDRVVTPEELADATRAEAARLAALKMDAHAGTKLRVREAALRAIREGIDREFPAG